ncbi:23S rRNA methyltransferase A [Vibrio cholerae]|nr:23S rRNA methyltransferase A [Vibrio cholerae]
MTPFAWRASEDFKHRVSQSVKPILCSECIAENN